MYLMALFDFVERTRRHDVTSRLLPPGHSLAASQNISTELYIQGILEPRLRHPLPLEVHKRQPFDHNPSLNRTDIPCARYEDHRIGPLAEIQSPTNLWRKYWSGKDHLQLDPVPSIQEEVGECQVSEAHFHRTARGSR